MGADAILVLLALGTGMRTLRTNTTSCTEVFASRTTKHDGIHVTEARGCRLSDWTRGVATIVL